MVQLLIAGADTEIIFTFEIYFFNLYKLLWNLEYLL